MTIQLEPWGGIAVHWPGAGAWLLIDAGGGGAGLEAWLVWRGRPLRSWQVASC